MVAQIGLGFDGWQVVSKAHPAVVALADRHYSRQNPGSPFCTPPGNDVVLMTGDELAAWVVLNFFKGSWRWRCTLFRNEGPTLSSKLIVEATAITYREWARKYGSLPSVPLRTEVDAAKTRRKRDPGRCFRKAGWRFLHVTDGEKKGRANLHVFEAPSPVADYRLRPETTAFFEATMIEYDDAGAVRYYDDYGNVIWSRETIAAEGG